MPTPAAETTRRIALYYGAAFSIFGLTMPFFNVWLDSVGLSVREIAADIQRLEALDRAEGLDDDARMELARLRIQAERASTRAMLADDLADRIDQAERTRDRHGGAAGT